MKYRIYKKRVKKKISKLLGIKKFKFNEYILVVFLNRLSTYDKKIKLLEYARMLY